MQVLALSLVLILPISAHATDQSAGQARIEFESSSHDFGVVGQHTTVSHSFVFHNTGESVLEVGPIESPCSCTATLLSSSSLAPGESGILEVAYSPGGRKGKTTNSLTLDTNDPANPSVTIEIEAEVRPFFTATPNPIVFDLGAGEHEKTVRLVPLGDSTLSIASVYPSTELLSATVTKPDAGIEDAGCDRAALIMLALADANIQPPREESVTVFLKEPPGAAFNIPVFLKRTTHISVQPPVVALGIFARGKTAGKVVRIQGDGLLDVRSLKATTTTDFINVIFLDAGSSTERMCRVEIDKSAPAGFASGEIVLRVEAEGPIIASIPVFGLIRDE
jgi:hypothetical protein